VRVLRQRLHAVTAAPLPHHTTALDAPHACVDDSAEAAEAAPPRVLSLRQRLESVKHAKGLL
jgi:hypothetical protein